MNRIFIIFSCIANCFRLDAQDIDSPFLTYFQSGCHFEDENTGKKIRFQFTKNKNGLILNEIISYNEFGKIINIDFFNYQKRKIQNIKYNYDSAGYLLNSRELNFNTEYISKFNQIHKYTDRGEWTKELKYPERLPDTLLQEIKYTYHEDEIIGRFYYNFEFSKDDSLIDIKPNYFLCKPKVDSFFELGFKVISKSTNDLLEYEFIDTIEKKLVNIYQYKLIDGMIQTQTQFKNFQYDESNKLKYIFKSNGGSISIEKYKYLSLKDTTIVEVSDTSLGNYPTGNKILNYYHKNKLVKMIEKDRNDKDWKIMLYNDKGEVSEMFVKNIHYIYKYEY